MKHLIKFLVLEIYTKKSEYVSIEVYENETKKLNLLKLAKNKLFIN